MCDLPPYAVQNPECLTIVAGTQAMEKGSKDNVRLVIWRVDQLVGISEGGLQ